MAKLLLSAFADEYADSFTEQLEALQKFDIKYSELRFIDKKNIAETINFILLKEIGEAIIYPVKVGELVWKY